MIIGIFSHFFALETTLAERQFFRALAKLIGRRAARLSACGIAAIVGKMGYLDEGCAVGADGSLYNVSWPTFFFLLFLFLLSLITFELMMDLANYRNILVFRTGCTKDYRTFLGKRDGAHHAISMYSFIHSSVVIFICFLKNSNIVMHHAEDGSGVGSAIIAGWFRILSLIHG